MRPSGVTSSALKELKEQKCICKGVGTEDWRNSFLKETKDDSKSTSALGSFQHFLVEKKKNIWKLEGNKHIIHKLVEMMTLYTLSHMTS